MNYATVCFCFCKESKSMLCYNPNILLVVTRLTHAMLQRFLLSMLHARSIILFRMKSWARKTHAQFCTKEFLAYVEAVTGSFHWLNSAAVSMKELAFRCPPPPNF